MVYQTICHSIQFYDVIAIKYTQFYVNTQGNRCIKHFPTKFCHTKNKIYDKNKDKTFSYLNYIAYKDLQSNLTFDLSVDSILFKNTIYTIYTLLNLK